MLASLAAAVLESSCYCGAVRLRVDIARPPLSVSICHCASCRRFTGAPMLANVMLPAAALNILPSETGETPPLVTLATSKQVTRHRCAQCHSPVYAMLGKAKVVVPLSLFSPPHPEAWRPTQHIYYDRRVLDMNDELPKYRTHYGSDRWAGEPPEAGASERAAGAASAGSHDVEERGASADS
jgi:hypothetical protein